MRVSSAVVGFACLASAAGAQTPTSLANLTLEELANIEVTSVSRRAESVADAPAAIYVISADDIRRSGAVTLPEALRLAPNLLVAQIDAGQYAITARGFNGLAANKLLVLVDGRTIYTPLFSGVFWDQQDVLLEDVERIEVISGPGATLWGPNAVNGVINIITRSTEETQGTVVSAGAGNRRQSAAVRYGGALGRVARFRIYGKAMHAEHTRRANDTPVADARGSLQAGFRTDWGDDRGSLMLQGGAHGVRSQDRGMAAGLPLGRAELLGVNLLGRWTRRFTDTSEFQLQAYVDHAAREERILFQPRSDLIDVELQHGVSASIHRFVWGAGYRRAEDEVEDGFLVGFRPTSRALSRMHLYAQDSIRLRETLELSAGLKLDQNDYTGWEYLPDARLGWKPSPDRLVWGSVSRAVRAPARFDRDVIRPLGGVFGGPDFVSEVANVYQAGYRTQAGDIVTWSVTAYLHDWHRLRSATAPPVFIENRIEGPVYGSEAWAAWQIVRAWRITAGATAMRKDLRLERGSTDLLGVRNPQLSNDPDFQWSLRSSVNLWAGHEFDAMVRHVDGLPNPAVPAYTAVDARYAWRMLNGLELSFVGQNLFDGSHPEFNAAPGRSEFERSVFVQARWTR
jgi:iron complex outermembrane receptor protein